MTIPILAADHLHKTLFTNWSATMSFGHADPAVRHVFGLQLSCETNTRPLA